MTMLRLAKRSETPYTGSLIYLKDENRKVVFSGKSFASVLADGEFALLVGHSGRQGYFLHNSIEEANDYRSTLKQPNHAVTIDHKGYIYDALTANNGTVSLVKTVDTVILSPFSFLEKYEDIANVYKELTRLADKAGASESLSEAKKVRAHHLKEMVYKVITLFKHTYELSLLTCAEFNDNFFDPNPLYANKTLIRLNIMKERMEELLADGDCQTSKEASLCTQAQKEAINRSLDAAISKSQREAVRHGLV
jgi:hypothetical protein